MLKRGIHSGVDSENVAYSCIKGGYILGGRLDYGRVAYRSLKVGILWEEGVDSGIQRHLT